MDGAGEDPDSQYSTWLPTPETTIEAQGRALPGTNPRDHRSRQEPTEEATPHRQEDIPKTALWGYRGGYTAVKDAVREISHLSREVLVPLVHRPGEEQADFAWALAKVGGVLRKVAFFLMALPYSDAFFVMAFVQECTETFWEAHVRAFEHFGEVPHRISYGNSRIAVSAILGGHNRALTRGFLELRGTIFSIIPSVGLLTGLRMVTPSLPTIDALCGKEDKSFFEAKRSERRHVFWS